MKYTREHPPLQVIMTNSYNYTKYKSTGLKTSHTGFLVHDTGAGNPYISRYVQPLETDKNYNQIMALLGKNKYGNDWNHQKQSKGVHFIIGRFTDGSVGTVQALPLDMACMGCGGGSKGSFNTSHIQVEICDDKYVSEDYFKMVYKEVCELAAYVCSLYNINPKGTTNKSGYTVPTVVCHQDAYRLGFGSNHGDVYGWFPKFGKTMAQFKQDVYDILNAKPAPKPTTSTTATPAPKPTTTAKNTVLKCEATVKAVQKYLNDHYKAGLTVDGVTGPKTKKAMCKAWQAELNAYGAGLTVDGDFGAKSEAAYNKIVGSLKRGDKGIFVTLWQATCVVFGVSVKGGIDGDWGNYTETATGQIFVKNKLDRDNVVNGCDLNLIM